MVTRLIRILLLPLALVAAAPASAQTTDAILDSLQYGAFRYAWDEANPANGLIKDRSTPGSPASRMTAPGTSPPPSTRSSSPKPVEQ